MAIVVVGGHTRSVGKTSAVAELIAALPELRWSAMKITQYGHGVCSADGAPCHCATEDHTWALSEEKDRSGESDTSRFLVAGAGPVWWVRVQQGKLAEAMPAIRRRIEQSENIIIESNSLLNFVRPSLYLTVLNPRVEDFKDSAQTFLDRADAILLHETTEGETAQWKRISLDFARRGRKVFRVAPPVYVSGKLIEFVREEIGSQGEKK